MQQTGMTIRSGGVPTKFASAAAGKGGAKPVNCRMGSDGECQRLNCYTTDRTVVSGIKCVNKKLKDCKGAIRGAQMAKNEKEAGLVPLDDDEPPEPDGSEAANGPKKSFGNLKDGAGEGDEHDEAETGEHDEAETAGVDNATDGSEGTNPGAQEAEKQAAAVAEEGNQEATAKLEEAEAAVKAMPGLDNAARAEVQAETGVDPGKTPDDQGPGSEQVIDPNAAAAGNVVPVPAAGAQGQAGGGVEAHSLEGFVRVGLAAWTAIGAGASAVQSSSRKAVPRDGRRLHQRHRCQDKAFSDFLCALPA